MTTTAYTAAKTAYAAWNVDTDAAITATAAIPVSLHCWQGDDVGGFEKDAGGASGGIQTTGNYPGKARTPAEVMADLDLVTSLTPGKKRLNLHAIYAITAAGETVSRDALEPRHFDAWLDWALPKGIHLDFNPTLFSHPLAAAGFTLASPDKATRDFWIRHVKATRKIAAYIGQKQGTPCLHNTWIPDGLKDVPGDKLGPRLRLKAALDDIFAVKYDAKYIVDSVECKVFGIGLESYTVGSSEFYIAYAAKNGLIPLLDNGHYHPTENVADKIPALLPFFDKIALHVTRGVRWDSDHVLLFDDTAREIAIEIVRNNAADRVLIGLDYFDASINRVIAWATGSRAMQKALLYANLLPHKDLAALQDTGNYSRLMATHEELKTLPFGAVWSEYLAKNNVPAGNDWITAVETYEKNVLSKRR
jgi:L-rhamnose isomerase